MTVASPIATRSRALALAQIKVAARVEVGRELTAEVWTWEEADVEVA